MFIPPVALRGEILPPKLGFSVELHRAGRRSSITGQKALNWRDELTRASPLWDLAAHYSTGRGGRSKAAVTFVRGELPRAFVRYCDGNIPTARLNVRVK